MEPAATVRALRLAVTLVGAAAVGTAAALTAAQLVEQLAALRRLSNGLGVIGLGGERTTSGL
jgi:hypothetical protein